MPQQVGRVSITFDVFEDRLRIDFGSTESQGGAAAVWITRRMAAKLLPQLLNWIEQSNPVASGLAPPLQHSVAAMEHAAIDARPREPVPPVRSASPPGLVASADIKRGSDALVMVLRDQAGNGLARLALSRVETHRLAGAIAHQMRGAGWAEGIELGWVDEAGALAEAAPPAGQRLN